MSNNAVRILYKDGAGYVREHRIVPRSLNLSATAGLPDREWFIHAFDVDAVEHRDFALSGILASGNLRVDEILRLQGMHAGLTMSRMWSAALEFLTSHFLTRDTK